MPAEVEMDRAAPSSRRAVGGRWRAWALLASLLANLFLGGVLIGHAVAPGLAAAPVAATGTPGANFAAKVRALSPVDRLKFAAIFARHRPEIGAARAELRQKNKLSRAAIAATPYDRARAMAAFADIRFASTRLQAALQSALADALAEVSPEGRSQLAAPARQAAPAPVKP